MADKSEKNQGLSCGILLGFTLGFAFACADGVAVDFGFHTEKPIMGRAAFLYGFVGKHLATVLLDELLKSMACKAAVKGGQKNSREELMVVARAVVTGQVKYCPHGRPVAITMTKAQLERQFKRA